MEDLIRFEKGTRVFHTKFGNGTIIEIFSDNSGTQPYLVEFDTKNLTLHNGGWCDKDFHCWYCYESEISKLELALTKNEEEGD